jgi:hypothetical protein
MTGTEIRIQRRNPDTTAVANDAPRRGTTEVHLAHAAPPFQTVLVDSSGTSATGKERGDGCASTVRLP